MAQLNEILAARFNEALTRLLQIQGGSPAPQLTPEITAVMELLGAPFTERWLTGWKPYSRSVDLAADGTHAGRWKLRNPVDSGVIVLVESMHFCPITNALAFVIGPVSNDTTDLATPVTGLPRDGRDNSTPPRTSSCIFSTGVPAAAGALAGSFVTLTPGNTPFEDQSLYVLVPGQSIQGVAGSNNAEILVGANWSERRFQPAELG